MPFGSVVLCLICPACGQIFDSAMQMEPRLFEQIRLEQPLERCSHCEEVNGFSKKDYLFRSTGGVSASHVEKDIYSEEMSTDEELMALSHQEIVEEVIRLRDGIRRHRDTSGHDLCWHHPELWGLLPESTDPIPTVPDWPQFLRGCIRYRQSLDEQLPTAPRIDSGYKD